MDLGGKVNAAVDLAGARGDGGRSSREGEGELPPAGSRRIRTEADAGRRSRAEGEVAQHRTVDSDEAQIFSAKEAAAEDGRAPLQLRSYQRGS